MVALPQRTPNCLTLRCLDYTTRRHLYKRLGLVVIGLRFMKQAASGRFYAARLLPACCLLPLPASEKWVILPMRVYHIFSYTYPHKVSAIGSTNLPQQ